MRRVRPYTVSSAPERLGRTIAQLPSPVRQALALVAGRDDLPLVAGVWSDGSGGCLVANVVAACAGSTASDEEQTLDLRVLELIPEMSSRDLNRLVVAWDEAALLFGGTSDADLRRLLRDALDCAAGSASLRGGLGSLPGGELVGSR